MRLTTIILSSIVIAVFSLTTAFKTTDTGSWTFLGDKNVGFGVDHDVIHFGNWKDDVRQIKLKITEGPLKCTG